MRALPLLCCLIAGSAQAASPALRQQMMQPPGWTNHGVVPAVDEDFQHQRYWTTWGYTGPQVLQAVSRASAETYTNAYGVLSYPPNNTGAWGSAGLQAWEGRTNLQLQSQHLSTSPWSLVSISVSLGARLAPDGTTTGALVSQTNVTATMSDQQNTNAFNAAGTYVLSVFYVNSGSNFSMVATDVVANGAGVVFNAATNAVVGNTSVGTGFSVVGSGVINGFANGYSLAWVAISKPSSGQSNTALALQNGTGTAWPLSTTVTGNASNGIYAWQFDTQVGSFVSPPIPTTTTNAARAADNITATGALATALAAATQTIAFYSNGSQQSLAGTIVDSNGTVLLGKTAGNALTTALGATLSTGNTGTWTGINKGYLAFNGAGGAINLNNGTSVTDATARTPGAPFHVGSVSGSSAFYDGNLTRLISWGSKFAPVLP